jgi:hypothetical protein
LRKRKGNYIMLTKKEFFDKFLSLKEYNGHTIISKDIGYGAEPDVYLEVEGDRRFYSGNAEYEKYCDAYKRFAEII